MSFSRQEAGELLRSALPVALGYIPIAIVFGFLFTQAGGPWWGALAASILVYAGSAQFLLIPMMAAGISPLACAGAVLILNLRHSFYGLSMLSRVKEKGWAKWYLIFALTDETFSLLTVLPEKTPVRHMALLAGINQLSWVFGTVVGAVAGAQAQLNIPGLDFVLCCLFAMLLTEQWRARKSVVPFIVAAVAFGLAWWLDPAHALTIAMGVCVAVGLVASLTTGMKGRQA